MYFVDIKEEKDSHSRVYILGCLKAAIEKPSFAYLCRVCLIGTEDAKVEGRELKGRRELKLSNIFPTLKYEKGKGKLVVCALV